MTFSIGTPVGETQCVGGSMLKAVARSGRMKALSGSATSCQQPVPKGFVMFLVNGEAALAADLIMWPFSMNF